MIPLNYIVLQCKKCHHSFKYSINVHSCPNCQAKIDSSYAEFAFQLDDKIDSMNKWHTDFKLLGIYDKQLDIGK